SRTPIVQRLVCRVLNLDILWKVTVIIPAITDFRSHKLQKIKEFINLVEFTASLEFTISSQRSLKAIS
ncbi:MAG: hypothetical protein K6C13_04795, partial [Oscillospiraceae bacterium]|nr:hypothetical protein [Oscillospiraceae bacterium]